MNSHLLVAALLLSGWASAQVPPTPAGETRPPVNGKVEERAEQMRENIGQGRQVRSHVRVAVRLKNGNKLLGVVKDGRMVERVDGLRFVEAQAKERGAGIRLWYSGGTRNYVFVPFADFQSYEVLQRLSQKQLDELELQMQMAERRAAERQAQQQQKANGTAEGTDAPAMPPLPGQPPTDGKAVTSADGQTVSKDAGKDGGAGAKDATKTGADGKQMSEQERDWFALLQQYPPKEGWNKAKKQEIASRIVVLHVAPSEKEKAFVDQFAEWEKACAFFKIDPDEPAKKVDDGSDEGDSGNGRRSKAKTPSKKPGGNSTQGGGGSSGTGSDDGSDDGSSSRRGGRSSRSSRGSRNGGDDGDQDSGQGA